MGKGNKNKIRGQGQTGSVRGAVQRVLTDSQRVLIGMPWNAELKVMAHLYITPTAPPDGPRS